MCRLLNGKSTDQLYSYRVRSLVLGGLFLMPGLNTGYQIIDTDHSGIVDSHMARTVGLPPELQKNFEF